MNELALIGGLVIVSIVMVIYALLPSKKDEDEHVRRRMAGKRSEGPDNPLVPKRERSAARDVLDKLTPYAMRPVMPGSEEEMTALRERLAQAGFRRESAVRYFLASKTIVGLGAAAVAVGLSVTFSLPAKQVFGIAAFAGGVGFMLPNMWLSMAQRQRMEKIRNGLPDSLDLMVVSVESGLALDAALQRVSDEMRSVHPELSEEMQIATLEGQMGLPRAEALQKMSRRCGVEEVQAVVSVIGQAERFGTSVAKALRTQADTLRTKRRLKAEERAQKTTVKLMVPLILFIFPSIFVVLAGPAALKIIKAFSSGAM
jgi:tight adherence protein C